MNWVANLMRGPRIHTLYRPTVEWMRLIESLWLETLFSRPELTYSQNLEFNGRHLCVD